MSRTRTITLTIGSLAAGAVLATGVTGLAMAADSTPSPSGSSSATTPGTSDAPDAGTAQGTPDEGMRGGRDGGRHGGMLGGRHGGPGGDALHSESVVKAADGTISTIRMIHGTVTAVSSSSITVKAEDGFTATYSIGADTEVHTGLPTRSTDGTRPDAPAAGSISDVKVGDVARVEGTVKGSTAAAAEVHALTAAEAAQLEKDRAAMDAQHQADDAARATASPTATQAG